MHPVLPWLIHGCWLWACDRDVCSTVVSSQKYQHYTFPLTESRNLSQPNPSTSISSNPFHSKHPSKKFDLRAEKPSLPSDDRNYDLVHLGDLVQQLRDAEVVVLRHGVELLLAVDGDDCDFWGAWEGECYFGVDCGGGHGCVMRIGLVGVVWCGSVWFGVVLCGVVWCAVVTEYRKEGKF